MIPFAAFAHKNLQCVVCSILINYAYKKEINEAIVVRCYKNTIIRRSIGRRVCCIYGVGYVYLYIKYKYILIYACVDSTNVSFFREIGIIGMTHEYLLRYILT